MKAQQQQYQNIGINSDTFSENSDSTPITQQDQYNLNPFDYNYPVQPNRDGFTFKQNSKMQGYFSPDNHTLQNWHILKIVCIIVAILTFILSMMAFFYWGLGIMIVFILHNFYMILYYCFDHTSRINQLKQITWIIGTSIFIFGIDTAYFIAIAVKDGSQKNVGFDEGLAVCLTACAFILLNQILFVICVVLENRKYKSYNSVLLFQPHGQNLQYIPVTMHQFTGKLPQAYQISPCTPHDSLQVNETPRMSMQQQQQMYQNMSQPQNSMLNNQVFNQKQQILLQQQLLSQFQPQQQLVIQPQFNPASLQQLHQQQAILNQQVAPQQLPTKQTKGKFLDDLEENLM
eukprot:403368834